MIETDRLQVLYEKKPCYEIVYKTSFSALAEEAAKLDTENRRICVITDSQVEKLYGEEVVNTLAPICKKVILFSFPEGEENKNLDNVKNAYEFLIKEGFDRKGTGRSFL